MENKQVYESKEQEFAHKCVDYAKSLATGFDFKNLESFIPRNLNLDADACVIRYDNHFVDCILDYELFRKECKKLGYDVLCISDSIYSGFDLPSEFNFDDIDVIQNERYRNNNFKFTITKS